MTNLRDWQFKLNLDVETSQYSFLNIQNSRLTVCQFQ